MDGRSILGCALNLSEGRDRKLIEAAAAAPGPWAHLLDLASDVDHNRTVLTLCGTPAGLVEALLAVGRVALENLDLRSHRGVHPRLGALDVVPFYPLRETAMANAVAAAHRCAERLWADLRLPCFLYGEAARQPAARELPHLRRRAFVEVFPDLGGPDPHPTAGAAVVGARGLLVAYNVELASADLGAARAVAATLRRRHPGYLRTLGLALASRGTVQVSMNVLRPAELTLNRIFSSVADEAARLGVEVAGSEIVGLVPRACLGTGGTESLRLREAPKVLEDAVDRWCVD